MVYRIVRSRIGDGFDLQLGFKRFWIFQPNEWHWIQSFDSLEEAKRIKDAIATRPKRIVWEVVG